MVDFADLTRLRGQNSALPPIAEKFTFNLISTDLSDVAPAWDTAEPQPISAFVCIIEYDYELRLITCRRYDHIGEIGYVGAVCHVASGYRQFRCDRITNVFDVSSGEQLGDASFFAQFRADSEREAPSRWGLTPSRKSTLVAGLNVLSFMARCDGHWHPLEAEVIERFVCSMWLRKEWDGDPPIGEIIAHTQRLSPDADLFFRSLGRYANSSTSTRVLCAAVADLIAADGRICEQETKWGSEINAFFRDYQEDAFRQLFLNGSSPF